MSNVEEGGVLGEWEYLFHSDLAFTDDPIRVLSLYALELPDTPDLDPVREHGPGRPAARRRHA